MKLKEGTEQLLSPFLISLYLLYYYFSFIHFCSSSSSSSSIILLYNINIINFILLYDSNSIQLNSISSSHHLHSYPFFNYELKTPPLSLPLYNLSPLLLFLPSLYSPIFLFYSGKTGEMSRRTGRNQGRLDLKLTMGTGRAANGPRQAADAAAAAAAADGGSPETSPTRSCVSSEESLKYSSSPEATSMVLVGCPRCLMYVMLSETDPRCPKCKSSVLLDFLRQDSKARLGN